jgi:hypothetical protein
MNIVTLDFETYFDADYTLSKMTTEAYIRDPRFEVHGCGIRPSEEFTIIRFEAGKTEWLTAEDCKLYFSGIDWSQCAVLCHHAQFDGFILSHHYGIRPKLWLDTLSMARLLIGPHVSASLASLAEHFGLHPKTIPYDLFKGKHWHELSQHTQSEVAQGCCRDVQLTWDIFSLLAQSFPQDEFPLVDATVRMFTEPTLVGNTARLGEIYQQEARAKADLLAELGIAQTTDPKTGKVKSELTKDWFFAKLLRDEGIEPEQKRGKDKPDGTPKWNYSFAKTDDFMRELIDDADDRVQLLAEARLAAKSNAIQTRSERLGWMSTRGLMCVYLNYAGTHLAGWSGGDKVNWQNFRRGGPIAEAIEAPQGELTIVADASQIECRLLNAIAGQNDVIERFRNREDPYTNVATQFYGRPITKADEAERGTGKQAELSCGYGAGAATIQATAKKGAYGPPVFLTDEDALRLRDTYRMTHPAVVEYWRQAESIIEWLTSGLEFEWGPLYIKDRRIWLPNDTPLIYETLEWHTAEDGDQFWRVRTRKFGWTKLYGSKLVENVIQALRNVHIKTAWLACMRAGIRVVSMEHDKLIACVREQDAQAAFDFLKSELSRAPTWLPGIPLDSEGYISRTLAKPITEK